MDSLPHVLVVEDDTAIQSMLEDVLCANGYSVAVATRGTEGLVEMGRKHPDLILLDLKLPDMNGWTFLETRESDRTLAGIPVLVLSAAEPAGLRRAQQLGAPLIVRKPFELEDLLGHVRRLCSGPVRQCAWCRSVTDKSGAFRLRSGRKLRWATHGICRVARKVSGKSF